ncbi:MAG: MBL fold metallo-hydrolase [Actinomycetota bacterium]|nr:MBL fold metallo-hydrolase [Actinomycetota bacterium]
MKQLAEDLFLLDGFPPYAINVYLIGDVLVDAATRHAARRILRQLNGRTVTTHALTHAHPDHQGASHEVCEALGIPLWCGELDADAMEDGRIMDRQPKHPINTLFGWAMPGPAHPVARRLREGDEVAGFQVLDVPGHSAGHIAFWRESDRALICGDVFTNIDTLTGIPGLHEPKRFFTPDPERNRQSMRRLAALEPAVVFFGHGRPLRSPGKLRAFTDKLLH